MRIRLLLDTNVILSGLFFAGRERKLLELIAEGNALLVLPESVLIECLRIVREKFASRPGAGEALVFLKHLAETAEIVEIGAYAGKVKETKKMIRDEKDAPVLAAALCSKPNFLVSGDKDFLELKPRFDFKIVSPRQFFEVSGK